MPFARRIAPARARSPVGQMSGRRRAIKQVDVRAPPPDADDAREHRPRVVVIRRGDRIEVQPAIEHVARQPDEVARLLPGLAGRAQALFPDGDDRCRLHLARRQDEPPERRFRRGKRDLLLEDDPDEGLEPGLATPQRRRSVALGDAGQVGVDRGEGLDGVGEAGLVQAARRHVGLDDGHGLSVA